MFTTHKAQAGLFLSMQHPPEISGVTINNFLRTATEALSGQKSNPVKFYTELGEKMTKLNIDKNFIKRYLNVGFSGGEKKQMEIIQLLTLNPKYAILDEIDSGLDVDALKMVAKGINKYHTDNNALLLITHYNRILKYVKPDFVHIMKDGKIVQTGDKTLARKIEKEGYKQ
jgi:Fe-S cluster assembly ATP-binding protein